MALDVYYRIYMSKELGNKLTILTLQSFDESSINQDRIIKDRETGEKLWFRNQHEAIQWLNENIKRQFIDPDYLASGPSINDYYIEDD